MDHECNQIDNTRKVWDVLPQNKINFLVENIYIFIQIKVHKKKKKQIVDIFHSLDKLKNNLIRI